MNLMRTLGGNSSRFCESPLSPSDSSLSIIISCMLNVSLRSIFLATFVLVGKNGDENSSSSLLFINQNKTKHWSICWISVNRCQFHHKYLWSDLYSTSGRIWPGIGNRLIGIKLLLFISFAQKHQITKVNINFKFFSSARMRSNRFNYYLCHFASILLWIVLFGTFDFQFQFTLKRLAWCVFMWKSAACRIIPVRHCWRLITIWILSEKNHFHIVCDVVVIAIAIAISIVHRL